MVLLITKKIIQPDQIANIFVDPGNDTLLLEYFNSNILSLRNVTNPEKILKNITEPEFWHPQAFNPTTHILYLTQVMSNNVTAIDILKNKTVSSIPGVEALPKLAINPKTNMVYMINNLGNRLVIIDGRTNSLVKSLILANFSVFTNAPTSTISTKDPILVDTTQNLIYGLTNGFFYVIDGLTNKKISTFPLEADHVVVNPLTRLIYVTHEKSNIVSVINGSRSVIGSVKVPQSTFNIPGLRVTYGPSKIAINPITNRVFILDSILNTVTIIDGKTDRIVDIVKVGSHPHDIAVNSISNIIYVTDPDSKSLIAIDGEKNNSITKIPVGDFPVGIAIDADQNIVYVSNTKNQYCVGQCDTVNNSLYVIDGNTNTVEGHLDTYLTNDKLVIDSSTHKVYMMSGDPQANYPIIRAVQRHGTGFYEVVSNITLPNVILSTHKPDMDIDPVANVLYIVDDSMTVYAVDTFTNSIVNTTKIKDQTGIFHIIVNPVNKMILCI